MSNFNTAAVINTNLIAKLVTDPDLGRKLQLATQASIFGGDNTISYDGVVALTCVESHKSDEIRLIAVGGDTGRDLGNAGKATLMAPGSERALFEHATANYDLVVRKEAVRGAKDEGTPEGATTPASEPAAS